MYYFEIKFIKYIFQKTSRLGKNIQRKMYVKVKTAILRKVIAAVFFCLFAKIITWKASCRVNV